MEKVFGEKISTIPTLDISSRYGSTDYIDFIKDNEVKYPVVRGIDDFSRPFFVMKVINEKNGKRYMQTFFQRETHNSRLWMGCGHYGCPFLSTLGGMTKDQFDLLKRLFEGQTCDVVMLHTFDEVSEQLRLCTQKEVDEHLLC
jgi:hypothetical protein